MTCFKSINFHFFVYLIIIITSSNAYCQGNYFIPPRHKVTLDEAHLGNEDIDMKLLESYNSLTLNVRNFYSIARREFTKDRNCNFTNKKILASARKNKIDLLGGPMLGQLNSNGVSIWLRPATKEPLLIKLCKEDSNEEHSWHKRDIEPGKEIRIDINGLTSDTEYRYAVFAKKKKLAEGRFKTAPRPEEEAVFRVQFGSCFHKIGIHNPNLVNQMLKRKPDAVMLLGDIAVDDRENNINLHRSDYLLRDLSKPWQLLAANAPLFTSWDDHDYFNNDLSGIPEGFTSADRFAVRNVWQQNWNNPAPEGEGVYFSRRMGPVEIFMLDTRSCRTTDKRGEYGSYLGMQQQQWLKEKLLNSTAPFKIISSGTMWSDYVTNGKDSWGTWDIEAREEIFNLIEQKNIPGILLISGDRHGARGFIIPRPSGFRFYEFEAASLGGVPGPNAIVENPEYQLFGYHGSDKIAFGEFSFDTKNGESKVIFRLIDEQGNTLEEHRLSYTQLTPRDL